MEPTEFALSQEDLMAAVENHCYHTGMARPPSELDITLLARQTETGEIEMKAVVKVEPQEESNIITDHLGAPEIPDLSPISSPYQGKYETNLLEMRLDRAKIVIEQARKIVEEALNEDQFGPALNKLDRLLQKEDDNGSSD